MARRLRFRREPVKLFGESLVDTLKRLRKLELLEPDFDPERQSNDYQAAMMNVDEQELKELMEQGSAGGLDDLDFRAAGKDKTRETRTMADMRVVCHKLSMTDVDRCHRALRTLFKYGAPRGWPGPG